MRLLVVGAALVWAWLAPARAFAAIIPVCDAPKLVSAMPTVDEPLCTFVAAVDEETGDTTVAPICDPRGASAIAPQRILPVSDATIDAVPGCSQEASVLVGLGPDHDHGSSPERSMVLHLAVIPSLPELAAFHEPRELPRPSAEGRDRAGERMAVWHPPR